MSALSITLLLLLAGCAGELEQPTENLQNTATEDRVLQQFSSQTEFARYMAASPQENIGLQPPQFARMATSEIAGDTPRHSTTNNQVLGLQEPDIVKTDGENIIYKNNMWAQNTTVLQNLPANLSVTDLDIGRGKFLLKNTVLIVQREDAVSGYNISNWSAPTLLWEKRTNSTILSARLQNDTFTIITQAWNDNMPSGPCEIRPMTDVIIPCTRIYHPPAPAESTYTVMKFNVQSGELLDSTAFMASPRNTNIYMSNTSLFLTYENSVPWVDVIETFIQESEVYDSNLKGAIRELRSYNLSYEAKAAEIRYRIAQWKQTLSKDDRLEVESELKDEMTTYVQNHKRDHVKTGIVKINSENLSVEAQTSVPGSVHNQFSIDEYNDALRLATTTKTVLAQTESENDVYILDKNLRMIGNVTGMGLDERIYAVRFIKDKGYVVTFKRIDPFHVLDLSNPSKPVLEGELKLPGFSSYLHPLSDTTILGIGEENGNVKAVLFNISNPSNPTVQDSYILDETWSAIRSNHHAFLHDEKEQIFFVPTTRGGYIFSYQNGLNLEKAVAMNNVQRAVYIGEYLYVLGDEVAVLKKSDWGVKERKTIYDRDQRLPVEPVPIPLT